MEVVIAIKKVGCQPSDVEEVQARRVRRWRLLILILVACGVAGLVQHGYTVEAALLAIGGISTSANVVAQYVLGRPAPAARTAA